MTLSSDLEARSKRWGPSVTDHAVIPSPGMDSGRGSRTCVRSGVYPLRSHIEVHLTVKGWF